MLSTNVLCLKKRKKRSYCIANKTEYGGGHNGFAQDKLKRSTMLQITEDTPPDMLAGAMDLSVHLPTGRSVKMSVERSTPMMDLLVQITTNNHLQLSGYTLQALGMAPSAGHGDKILPFKPNTPIGALDTQHVRVVPKSKTLSAAKSAAPGHQPFESTFRLKVHLPRNQLYVTRVSQSVHLDDIMRKVCEEKNLDPLKYEFRHPGNLDEVLNPKLTLSDYQITEIYIVIKGTASLNQAFSTSDIMALRKEEERKQMHNKTGGGVFNLIFRRGKSSTGSGSLSSENRSISPTQSDDSRSVTPPSLQAPILTPPPQVEPPPERPKPPQRKRRPAPKPPQEPESRKTSTQSETAPQITAEDETKKIDPASGLTICHSRNSSDSSGYHEASVLSDNCNTSLPRRPKSTVITEEPPLLHHSQSTSNLVKMSMQSKSTSSLAFPSRKKKSAPAPPPPPAVLKSASSVSSLDKPSPVVVVASQPQVALAESGNGNGQSITNTTTITTNPVPAPRSRNKLAPPIPCPRTIAPTTRISIKEVDELNVTSNRTDEYGGEGEEAAAEAVNLSLKHQPVTKAVNFSLDKHESVTEALNLSLNKHESVTEAVNLSLNNHEPVIEALNLSLNVEDTHVDNMHEPHDIGDENQAADAEETKPLLEEQTTALDLVVELKPVAELCSVEANAGKVYVAESEESSIEDSCVNSRQMVGPEPEEIVADVKTDQRIQTDDETKIVDAKTQIVTKDLVLETSAGAATKAVADEASQAVPAAEPENAPKVEVEFAPEIVPKVEIGTEVATQVEPEVATQVEPEVAMQVEPEKATQVEPEVATQLEPEVAAKVELVVADVEPNIAEEVNPEAVPEMIIEVVPEVIPKTPVAEPEAERKTLEDSIKQNQAKLLELQKHSISSIFTSDDFVTSPTSPPPSITPPKPPEIVGVIPKAPKDQPKTMFDSFTRKRGFQIGSSLTSDEDKVNSSEFSSLNSVTSALNAFKFVDEIEDVSLELFTGSLSKNSKNKDLIVNQLHGMHELESIPKNTSATSLKSVTSIPGFSCNMKKWNNTEELDNASPSESNMWVIGDSTSDTESMTSLRNPLDSFGSVTSIEHKEPISPPPPIEEKAEEPKAREENNEELDWQYQLPSPPKAFRDSSPVPQDIPDSVVTSPELFEKLTDLKKTEVSSEITSTVSTEEEKPILNKLSLENLEKRKSLVYNRELATSLKMAESSSNSKEETFSSSLTKFEKTYEEVSRRSSLQRDQSTNVNRSTLPNFKITTYDNPKKNIDIFEDDTIRSSNVTKRNSFVSPRHSSDLSKSSHIGRSMENISFRKNSTSSEDELKKPSDSLYKFYRPQQQQQNHVSKTNFTSSVFRSESFSSDHWTPSRPVARSKSQVALNRSVDRVQEVKDDGGLSKSNSLFDVSGLQSLGVIRLIQNKLNTPTSSTEHLDKVAEEPTANPEPFKSSPPSPPEIQTPPEPAPKTYVAYRAPSINMGTWSDRPKIPVNVKDDPDYKFGANKDNLNSKLIVNTTNNNYKSSNSVEIKSFNGNNNNNNNRVNVKVNGDPNVSIKVNGSEPISAQHSGNVVIKIGEPKPYRRPLGDVNKNEQQRPHSIAFGSDFDISRVPIVRSVELKKPYRDMNGTSITQIYQNGNAGGNGNSFKSNGQPFQERKVISETALKSAPPVEPKPSFRLNSYSTPVVRGFSGSDVSTTKRMSWGPHSFSTLPSKTPAPRDFSTNKSVPFSQHNLRRTESTKTNEKPQTPQIVPPPVQNAPPPPKPPPSMPKATRPLPQTASDPKEQLLQAIRDFGGKKGLRSVRT